MSMMLGFLLFAAICGLIYLGVQFILVRLARVKLEDDLRHEQEQRAAEVARLHKGLAALKAENERLAKWKVVADADAKAAELLETAKAELDQAEIDAAIFIRDAEQKATDLLENARQEASATSSEARQRSKTLKDEAQALLNSATTKAAEIVEAANHRAEAIAGSAYDAVRNAEMYEKTAKAMKNIVKGYGDQYLVPAHSLIDDLAEDFSHKKAGQELKRARAHAKVMIDNGTAAQCDYVETRRKEMAERFVLDAFNGKVDSILSRVKHDNAGKLEQEVRDAFTVVNYTGQAFRNARVTEEYSTARIEELEWAAVAHQLKLAEREEQRRIREQIREEEKARKEYERARREAEKEEKMLRKAMAKAQQQVAEATEEQRAQYERQLQELSEKLQTAEEKNQRALSMAQQTKRGHVYIISNVGSFGENIYKIGLTRRLNPLDRVKELGDSSVPFDFDVHSIIFSEDAPALENQLHKHFVATQMNKVNYRKEFFRVDVAHIREETEKLGLDAKWTMKAEATEYRESLAIEEAIKNDPEAKEAWLNRQLTLDPITTDDEAMAVG